MLLSRPSSVIKIEYFPLHIMYGVENWESELKCLMAPVDQRDGRFYGPIYVHRD